MTKTTRKTASIIDIKSFFQITLFIALCWYMARCSSYPKTGYSHVETRVTNNSEVRKRGEIARYAKKHIGTKYKYAGRSPKGFDCSGFTYYVMKNFDVDLVPVSREQEKQGKFVSTTKVKSGDLLFFRRSKKGTVFHVALVVSNDSKGLFVIHSTSSRGVVLDNITESSYWQDKIMTARNVLGTTQQ